MPRQQRPKSWSLNIEATSSGSRDFMHLSIGLVIAISFPLRRRHVSFVTGIYF
jgi:hypothetical protein